VTTPLRARFLLDPDVCYLNHGAFGAAPIPVFEAYQAWQRELERQPTRTLEPALAEARRELAAYVGAGEDDLTFVPTRRPASTSSPGRSVSRRGTRS
jgi:isopenicillin-N epimerase